MLKLYNTLTQRKEAFRPRRGKKVNIFVCGPTVYDLAHLGHARTYIAFDIIVKYLRYKEYNVFYLQNITDIDDKIIKRANEKKITPKELAKNFEREYFRGMKDLKVNSITKYAKATSYIKEIISQVKRLIKKGYGYQIEDGIYYDIGKFKDYGKLSKRTALQAEDAVSRIDESKEKRNKGDFCLWKFSKPGEPKWKSPWGEGRPGWHIEDTAITEKYFGQQYDIHGGGKDLIFPHHEAEIAQMEGISGKKPLANYWLHTEFITVKKEKMSKSLGNFITIQDFLKEHSPRLLRFMLIKNYYRSPIDYDEKMAIQAQKGLERIDEFIDKLKNHTIKKQKSISKGIKKMILKTEGEFNESMDDDFNTPKAIASIFQLVNDGNYLLAQNKIAVIEAKYILNFLKKIDKVLNFIFFYGREESIPKEIYKLAQEREKYRKAKNWQKSDEVRMKIKELGYQIEDTKTGPKIKKL